MAKYLVEDTKWRGWSSGRKYHAVKASSPDDCDARLPLYFRRVCNLRDAKGWQLDEVERFKVLDPEERFRYERWVEAQSRGPEVY